MKQLIKFISIISLFLLTSCATRVPFTSDLQAKFNFSENTLKKVQFYTSDKIVLTKVKEEGDVDIQKGKLLVKNEKNCETIIINKNTPCVLEQVIDQNKFLFSFEFGDDKYLAFGNTSTGCYSLLAKDWKNGSGTLKYANKTYITDGGDVFLTVDMKKLNKLKSKERTVKGRKI